MPFDSAVLEIQREIAAGDFEMRKKRYKKAALHYLTALNKCGTIKHRSDDIAELEAGVLKSLAEADFEEGDLKYAQFYLQNARDRHRKIRDRDERISFRAELNFLEAKISFEKKDYEDALDKLHEAAKFYKAHAHIFYDVNFVEVMFQIALYRAWAELFLHNFEDAIKVLSEKIEGDPSFSSAAHRNYYEQFLSYRTLLHFYNKDVGKALGGLQILSTMRLEDPEAKAVVKMIQALVEERTGNRQKAKRYFKEASKYADKFRSKLMQAEMQGVISSHLLQLEQLGR